MAIFTDNDGRQWKLHISNGLITDLREAGLDIKPALTDQQELVRLIYGDPEKFGSVVWFMIEPQAKEAGVSERDFSYGLDGRAIERAVESFLEAVADFSPRSKIATLIKNRLPEVMAAFDQELEDRLNERWTSRGLPGNSPELSGSTRDP